jgi:hypothetical protein
VYRKEKKKKKIVLSCCYILVDYEGRKKKEVGHKRERRKTGREALS